jgi:hypothetical protein
VHMKKALQASRPGGLLQRKKQEEQERASSA